MAHHLVRKIRPMIPALVLLSTLAGPSLVLADDTCFVERGRLLIPNITSVAVSGHLVALVQRGGWDTRPMVRIVRIYDSGLVETGHWEATWGVEDIHLDASTAIAAADFGLVSLDLGDPYNPVELDFIDLLGAEHLAVANGYAHSASDGAGGNGWFDVVEITDPSRLGQRGELYWPRPEPYPGKTAMDASDGIAVMSSDEGVVVMDVSDPWHPTERGLWSRNGARDVALVDGLVAVAITSWVDPLDIGIEILDLSDPDAPVALAFWQAPSEVHSVAEFGGTILAGTDSDGLFLISINDPSNPVVIDHLETPGLRVRNLAAAWPTVVLSDFDHGVMVLGLDRSCIPPRLPSGRVGR